MATPILVLRWSVSSSCYAITKPKSLCSTPHHNNNLTTKSHPIFFCSLNAQDKGGMEMEGVQVFSRKESLRKLDLELDKGNEKEALSIVTFLQGKSGGLRGFGGASQVPQRLYTLEDLRLNKIETTSLLSPIDTTLGAVRRNVQITTIAGGVAAWRLLGLDQFQLLFIVLAFLAFGTIDLIFYGGGVESLLVDTIGRLFSNKYRDRVAQHEAGHFLIAYLLGVLPKGYTLSSLDAFKKNGSLNIQAGSAFVDFQFLEEVKSGKISSGGSPW